MKAVGLNIIFEYFETNLTAGGIYTPTSTDANNSSVIGKVVSVGSQVQYVKAGDTIVVPKLMRTPLDADKGLYMTPEHQVLAIIDG